MSFASQLYDRCYLLPEQLSKDQSSTASKPKCTILDYISYTAPFSERYRFSITVKMGGRESQIRIASQKSYCF